MFIGFVEFNEATFLKLTDMYIAEISVLRDRDRFLYGVILNIHTLVKGCFICSGVFCNLSANKSRQFC